MLNERKIGICPYCERIFKNGQAAAAHRIWCNLNPNKKARAKYTRRKPSDETKLKISNARLKFLNENPDKVPYLLNHSSKISWPEKIFKNALIASGITGWVYNYQNGIYQYDFAFPELKIDVEIDGGTHLTEKVKKIDERRDLFSKNKGWRVIRFPAKKVKENIIECIEELKKIMIP